MLTSTHDVLRPQSLDEFVGQERLKRQLRPWIAKSCTEREPMGNVLLASGPGMGKTTAAEVIAAEVGDPIERIDLARMTDRQFISYMRRFEGGVLFCDELHRAKPAQQEQLLTLMWEKYVPTQYGGRIDVPWCTVIAATTEKHKLLPAVIDRFEVPLDYEPYTDDEMAVIVCAMAEKLRVEIDAESQRRLALAAGGVPRPASRLVRAWQALTYEHEAPTVEKVLFLTGREPDGLTTEHLEYLRTLDKLEGIAGETRIAKFLRMHPSQVSALEVLLFTRGLIAPTPQGTVLTGAGNRRLRGDAQPIIRRAK